MDTNTTHVAFTAPDDDLRTVVRVLRQAADNDGEGVRVTVLARACRDIANMIDAQTPAPRPPQPGHLGMVEASCVHSDIRGTWVRVARGWVRIEAEGVTNPKYEEDDWDSLVDPVAVKR